GVAPRSDDDLLRGDGGPNPSAQALPHRRQREERAGHAERVQGEHRADVDRVAADGGHHQHRTEDRSCEHPGDGVDGDEREDRPGTCSQDSYNSPRSMTTQAATVTRVIRLVVSRDPRDPEKTPSGTRVTLRPA